jgi:hypothetical protein
MMGKLSIATALAALLMACGAQAAVVDATPNGFQVEETADIGAPAAKVWQAIGDWGDWWSGQHAWSGDAHNLTLDLKAGGCLCERLPDGGGVRHMTVLMTMPDELVVLDGALGPLLFSGATGRLRFKLAETGGHTTLTMDYWVGGYYPGGFDKIAPAVDGVLGDQAARLKRYVETGKADSPPT